MSDAHRDLAGQQEKGQWSAAQLSAGHLKDVHRNKASPGRVRGRHLTLNALEI